MIKKKTCNVPKINFMETMFFRNAKSKRIFVSCYCASIAQSTRSDASSKSKVQASFFFEKRNIFSLSLSKIHFQTLMRFSVLFSKIYYMDIVKLQVIIEDFVRGR